MVKDRIQPPNPRVWTRIGCTKKGRDIYRSILGNYAVEQDHRYLAGLTEEEKKEIKRL
jgi:DNA-binding MarR family transcriptional regulator